MGSLSKAGSLDRARIKPGDISQTEKTWSIGGLSLSGNSMSFKEGTAERFSVSSAGTVSHGKSKVERVGAESGLILYSPTKKWKLEVSDTGQILSTQIA